MKLTSELINDLAIAGLNASPRSTVKFLVPLVLTALLCFVLLALVLGPPLQPLAQIGAAPYAMKLSFAMSVAFLGAVAAYKSSLPGRAMRHTVALLLVPFGAVFTLAAMEAITAGLEWPGDTWLRCLGSISLLWPFCFAGFVFALRSLAPTHLRISSAIASLAAAGIAASAYGLWCPETNAQFLANWYALPILIFGLAGAVIGPPLIRW